MPSFDIVSELDNHEVSNAVDQANKEVGTRFDFKGSNASFELDKDNNILMRAESTFQLQQMLPIEDDAMAVAIQMLGTGRSQVQEGVSHQGRLAGQGSRSDGVRSRCRRQRVSRENY